MTRAFYITTPIYYVNARPHLGHAYTTIVADVARRFHDMVGDTTFFLTGTDEHGDKIVQAAQAEGQSPREYVDTISALFQNLWPELNISNDRFIRTTDTEHIAIVEQLLQKIHDQGDIYFSEYEGLYCYGCERFYTDRELVDGKCPDHQTTPDTIREANYFFKMSRYQQWLIDHIKQNPDFIRPERYRNEVLAFLREPLEDLCISRPKSRLQWGITLPFDDRYVTYVWFDALVNYLTGIGYPDENHFKTFWPGAQHIVAKDILKPHGIYWPCMLKAAGIPLYRHLNVHGYWNIDASKMSKSLGNVVEPLAMRNTYGDDAFRYFLLREMAFGLDANFSESALVARINSDLANDLGNLFSRVVAMTHKYFDGAVPAVVPAAESDIGMGLAADVQAAISTYETHMANFAFHKALMAVWELISQMNKYIDVTAPWVLAKKKATRPQLETVMYMFLEGLRVITGLVYPVMPAKASAMQTHLGLDAKSRFYDLGLLRKWGVLPPGTSIPKAISLFPRITPPPAPEADADRSSDGPKPPIKEPIQYADFERIDLRVATIISAEPIPKAKKLLKLEIDLGEIRTVVAGIATTHTPTDLIGRQVVVVANLEPAKLMGVTSNGMLLAASDKSGLAILGPERELTPGSPVK